MLFQSIIGFAIVLTVLGDNGELDGDMLLNNMIEKYELGNGQPLPETVDGLAAYCLARGDWRKSVDQMSRDIHLALRLVTEFKSIPRLITLAGFDPDHVTIVNTICHKQNIKETKIINAKLTESKALKANVSGYIWKLIQDGAQASNLSHILCLSKKYMDNQIELQLETDGGREFARTWFAPTIAIINKAYNLTGINLETNCQFEAPPQQALALPSQTSFHLPFLKAINLFYVDE